MTVSEGDFKELKFQVRKNSEDISNLKTRDAVTAVQNENVLNKLKQIDEDVKGLKSNISKLVWLVVAAIIGGLANSIEWGWKIAG